MPPTPNNVPMTAVTAASGATRSEWSRRYPPLAALVIALVIAVVVLPSALNLPQSNPATTLELAPVPPSDDKTPPPPLGNLSTLSLGGSSTIGGAGASGGGAGSTPGASDASGGGLPGSSLAERHKTPRTKNCVNTPQGLRQTEDPLSPPCVADFEGDNGGATYTEGVTGDEVRLLIYTDATVYTQTARGQDTSPQNTIIDLDAPAGNNEIGFTFVTRNWSRYFNDRYQTYNRHVHFFLQYGSYSTDPNASGPDAGSRQQDAAQAFSTVHPFAVIAYPNFNGSVDYYLRYMAQRGVLNFGSFQGREAALFQQFPKLIWGYPPTIQQVAQRYAEFVCKTIVAPGRVSFAGAGITAGAPRKLGLIETADPGFPNLKHEADLVRQLVQQCGGQISDQDVVTYPVNGYVIDTSTTERYAIANMNKLQSDGVTTLLWPAGTETKQGQAATQLRYFPEWLIGPDGYEETTSAGQYQDQQQWTHAFIVPFVTRRATLQTDYCYQAYREVDTQAADSDINSFACLEYPDLRMVFTGIQVAGPKLGPYSIDKGYHAIPKVASTDPRVPACFYDPGDYTCVKDTVIEYWDPAGTTTTNSQPGCWRMIQGGRRYPENQLPSGDPLTLKTASDPCNSYDNQTSLNYAAPGPNS